MLTGGGHERNRRSGTENVAGIVGFGEAARLARQDLVSEMSRVRELRDRLESELKSRIEFIHSQWRKGARGCRTHPTSWWITRKAKGWSFRSI